MKTFTSICQAWSLALVVVVAGACLPFTAVATNATDKESWTPGCISLPFPTTPVGPTNSVVFTQSASGVSASGRVTLWRVPCAAGDHQLLVTVAPISGTPYPLFLTLGLVQRGFQYQAVLYAPSPLLTPITIAFSGINEVEGPVGAPEFDDDLAFEMVLVDQISFAVWRIQAPAAPGASPMADLSLRGAFSGSWYDPNRAGQGVMLEFGRVGSRRVAFVTWYTQINGQQAWIAGNSNYNEGDTSLTVTMYRSQGGSFPTTPGGSAGTLVLWGTVTLRFTSCSQLQMSFQSASEGSGQLTMVRGLSDGLDGFGCNN